MPLCSVTRRTRCECSWHCCWKEPPAPTPKVALRRLACCAPCRWLCPAGSRSQVTWMSASTRLALTTAPARTVSSPDSMTTFSPAVTWVFVYVSASPSAWPLPALALAVMPKPAPVPPTWKPMPTLPELFLLSVRSFTVFSAARRSTLPSAFRRTVLRAVSSLPRTRMSLSSPAPSAMNVRLPPALTRLPCALLALPSVVLRLLDAPMLIFRAHPNRWGWSRPARGTMPCWICSPPWPRQRLCVCL